MHFTVFSVKILKGNWQVLTLLGDTLSAIIGVSVASQKKKKKSFSLLLKKKETSSDKEEIRQTRSVMLLHVCGCIKAHHDAKNP